MEMVHTCIQDDEKHNYEKKSVWNQNQDGGQEEHGYRVFFFIINFTR